MTKLESEKLWTADGFHEDWSGYPKGSHEQVVKIVKRYENVMHTALDIGCGRGDLTNELIAPNFNYVVALDLLDKPELIRPPAVEYHQVPDGDTSCSIVMDASIDFVWSFGLFCHLPNSMQAAYLKSIRRVLKPYGVAVVMFPNWRRHPARRLTPNPERFRETPEATWYYGDVQTAQAILAAGLSFVDLLPDFRDTLAELRPR